MEESRIVGSDSSTLGSKSLSCGPGVEWRIEKEEKRRNGREC